jgi:hypothetical protein
MKKGPGGVRGGDIPALMSEDRTHHEMRVFRYSGQWRCVCFFKLVSLLLPIGAPTCFNVTIRFLSEKKDSRESITAVITGELGCIKRSEALE